MFRRSSANFYIISRQVMRVQRPQAVFFPSHPALSLKFYSPESRGLLKNIPLEELCTNTDIPSHGVLDEFKAANVPKISVNLWSAFRRLRKLPAGVTPQILAGVTAWTHAKSALSQRYYTGFRSEYEQELYSGVQQFAQLSLQTRSPDLQIEQSTICRGIHSKYLDLFSQTGMKFEELLEPHPDFLYQLRRSRMGNFGLLDYQKEFPKDTIIQFNPVTSWTLYDLRNKFQSEALAYPYPDTSDTDIIFVAVNANQPHSWGSAIGRLSIVPEEKEVLIPSHINMRVIKGAHMKRDMLKPIRSSHKVAGGLTSQESVIQFVHVIYVEFVSAP